MKLKSAAVSTIVAAGATGLLLATAAPAATARTGEHRPSAAAARSSSVAEAPSVELHGLPGEFVPGAGWSEFTVGLRGATADKQFHGTFFQVHDTLRVGLKSHQIKVQYFLDGRWQAARSFNDSEDNWQDFPIPVDEAPIPVDVTEIPIRLKFEAGSPFTDRIDIGALSHHGPTDIVEIKPLKVIRLVPETPGQPDPTASPTASPTATPTATPTASPTGTPTADPTASPTADPTASPTGDPSPTASPTSAPTGDPSATATPPATGGGSGTDPGASGPSAPAPEGELAHTGADATGTPLTVGLIALGSGTALALATRAARERRRRH
ncbi:hypothetical protein ACIBCA_03900 [Kitasatospora sp. NPDC051170]|uniref:hypothetical protein n=1 Tax=Kitasatospora sp. NPDC051170 TaxID=3364056 RepID=UPI0037911E70